jgi:hypothetical protein
MTIKTRSSKASKVTEDQNLAGKPTGNNSSPVQEVFTDNIKNIPDGNISITGRGIFAVRILGNAVSVQSAFIKEDGEVLSLPAVFPDRQYALSQIDELRQIVNQHFDELDKQLSSLN